jgi:hypothetical protein
MRAINVRRDEWDVDYIQSCEGANERLGKTIS